MDPERQPLLDPVGGTRCRRYRPLTHEEVLTSRQQVTWRRTKFFLIVMFWAIMTMLLSIIACMLINASSCNIQTAVPSVPPVHLTFAPLLTSGKALSGEDFISKRDVTEEHMNDKIFQL